MSNIILEAKHISKQFHDPATVQVLNDISFKVFGGEFVSIMGRSGSGKSTLLYVVSTMDTRYEGQLFLKDELLTGQSNRQLSDVRNKHIGFVFQFHFLLPEFTVLENVMLPAKKLGKKTFEEIEDDARGHLRLLGMEDKAAKKANAISGGEKQRVAIARALINDPAIMMCDEPTGNLDSRNAHNVFDIFKSLTKERNLSLLVVTHDLDFAKGTDRILEMEDGKIIHGQREN